MMTGSYKPITPRNPTSVYFGKIASRGDFVRSNSGTKLISLLDNWVAQGMDLLIAESDWKHRYDERGLIDFLFLGMQKKHAVCGAVIPSSDASSRRFPFIAATLFEVDNAIRFFPFSALTMERHLNQLRALIQLAAETHDATGPLAALSEASSDPTTWNNARSRDNYLQFLDATNLDGLSKLLDKSLGEAPIRQLVLALGHLLQPMMTNYAIPPQKGIALPLPQDPAHSALVKTLWLDMIVPFLRRTNFEISVFSYQHDGVPKLVMSFNGATPATFCALFSEPDEQVVDLVQSAWVEECVRQDPAVVKLSSYLEHGPLTLRQLVDTFCQSFIG
jgi:type VI secretion system protein ImpM